MTEQKKRIVFISYAHADSDFVNLFASLLLNFNIRFWLDSKDIPVGGEILDNIYEGIKGTSHFCCIISSSSVKSAWVKEELKFAKHRSLRDKSLALVPVLIDEVEIPDYVVDHLCAHLEDRNLSLKNPELLKLLAAFGVNLEKEARRIITGPERGALLKSCVELREGILQLREWLATYRQRCEEHRTARSVSRHVRVRLPPPPRKGFGRPSHGSSRYRLVPNPNYSEYAISQARERARSALRRLRVIASHVLAAIGRVRRAGQAAGINLSAGLGGRLAFSDTGLWVSLNDALDLARGVSETISGKSLKEVGGADKPEAVGEAAADEDAEEDAEDADGEDGELDYEEDDEDVEADEGGKYEEPWWVREKLPRWISSLPRVEAAVESAAGMLAHWGRFD